MRRALTVSTLAMLLVAGVLASTAAAKPPPDKGPGKDGPPVTGVIYAGSAEGFWEMAADGSSERVLGCGGDLSRAEVALGDISDRLLLSTPYHPTLEDPFGNRLQRPVVVPFAEAEAGSCTSRPVAVDFPTPPIHGPEWAEEFISIMAIRWSPAADAVAMLVWTGAVPDERYVYGAYDLWIADAVPDGFTMRFTNLRDVTAASDYPGDPPDDPARPFGLVGLPYSFSSDGAWIAYWRTGGPGAAPEVLVTEVATGEEHFVADGYDQAFSPVEGDLRLVFIRNAPDYRPYLWTGTWDPGTRQFVDERQVTTKKTGSLLDISWPSWSHDGMHLAFSAAQGWSSDYDIYRVRADGKGKAVTVNQFDADFQWSAPAWHADPAP